MSKSRAATWFLVSLAPLWFDLAAAEPPKVEPAQPAAITSSPAEWQENKAPREGRSELRGVVIEEVPKGSTLEKAGLLVGDVITTWKRLPNPPANPDVAEGEMASYFDWQELEVEQAPRGTVVLRGGRGGVPIELRVEQGEWDAKARPVLPRALEQIYLAGKASLASGDIEAAVQAWQLLAENPEGERRGDLKTWIVLRIGGARGEKGDSGKTVEAYGQALRTSQDDRGQIAAWEALGEAHERHSEYEAAEKAYLSALEIGQKLNRESLRVARDLNNLGEVVGDRGDLRLAHDYFSRALEISEHLAPQSLLVARTLNNLGAEAKLRGDLDRAQDLIFRALAIRRQLAPISLAVAEGLNNLGVIAETRSEFEAAKTYLLQALQIRQQLVPGSLNEANTLNNLGVLLAARGQLDLANKYHRRALQIREQLAPKSLALATSLYNVGLISKARGELDSAHDFFSRALAIRKQLAPNSISTAHSLNILGELAWQRGELNHAEDYFRQALEICMRVAPKSLDEAIILNNLGTLAAVRGDLVQTNSYFLQAFQIQKFHAPRSLDLALSLHNLGALSQERGELDRAYDYYDQSLQIKDELAPESLSVASTLSNIGAVMRTRGELDRAQNYYRRALLIQERLSPQSPDVAESLNKLGILAQGRGELDRAYHYYRRSLDIRRRLVPRSLAVAESLNNLGSLSELLGNPKRARDYHIQALTLKEQLAPKSPNVAISLNHLGELALSHGELQRADDYFLQALGLTKHLTDQSLDYVGSLRGLGFIAQARKEPSHACSYFSKAIDALEHQVSRLGGSYNTQAGFRSQHRGYYHDLLNLLLAQQRFPEAFQILERFRAQTFLTMLAERDVAFTADIPEDLDRERRRISVLYDHILKQLAGLNPRDNAAEIEATRKELQKLDNEAGDMEARIRSTSPKLAALRYPQTLDAPAAKQALDTGTLLLSFSVGKDRTALYALSREEGLEVKILPLGEEALRSRLKLLLALAREAKGGASLGEHRRTQLLAASREIYTALLGQVANRIAASERLLILPDGPLHVLPFGALVHDTKDGPQYLAAWKPIHIALSATVYAELKQRRRSASDQDTPQASLELAAFGDPIYPQSLAALKNTSTDPHPADGASGTGQRDPTVRGAAERGLFDFEPLPYTRREVLEIASLFPAGTAHTYLGAEALEERVKGLDPKTRILHLAAHASVDGHLPSGSFIALTIPGGLPPDGTGPQRDNGLLQVWEIFEQVRLNADLVVLSACDTGLGEELGGEGLIGLTRAFQYAGARSVMASLWKISDRTTAELMVRFYKHLKDGLAKDEALRAAQMELIRGPIQVKNEKGEVETIDASAPYYWAAFQIYGDWQ